MRRLYVRNKIPRITFPCEGQEEAAVTETRTCRRQSCHVIVTCRMNRMFSPLPRRSEKPPPPSPNAFCTVDVCGTRKPRLDTRGSGGPSDPLCDPYFRGYSQNMKSNGSSGLFMAQTAHFVPCYTKRDSTDIPASRASCREPLDRWTGILFGIKRKRIICPINRYDNLIKF